MKETSGTLWKDRLSEILDGNFLLPGHTAVYALEEAKNLKQKRTSKI